jgi:hypothetical protein
VREHYRAGIKGVPKTIASQWGWPDWVVKKKAAELGLTAAARYAENHRAWTAAEEALLRKHLGSRTPLWIAKKLGRSTTAVVMKVKHLNLSYALREGYTERRLMECFGVDHHTITRWIDAGKLRRRERPYSGRRALCLTNVDVLEFIQNHPDAFELSRVDQTWFMDLILGGGLLRRALWREADARRFSPPSAHRHSKERVA